MPRKLNGKSKVSKTARKKKSVHDKWLSFLRRNYGSFDSGSGPNAQHGMLLVVQATSKLPPRMPAPRGPSPGAIFTTVQLTGTFNTSTAVASGVIVQNGATAVLGAIAFRLDDLPQVTTFSSMFDQYRIEEVHLRLRPRSTSSSLFNSASPNQVSPQFHAVIDRDDSSAPAAISDMDQYDNAVQFSGVDGLDVILQPSITPSVFSSGAFSGYAVKNSKEYWIDVANTGVPHYGVKFAISALQVSSTMAWAWDVYAWYKVSFRNTR